MLLSLRVARAFRALKMSLHLVVKEGMMHRLGVALPVLVFCSHALCYMLSSQVCIYYFRPSDSQMTLVLSEILVDVVDVILQGSGIDEKFLGVTLFALVPNTTEFMNAMSFALNGNIALR